MQWQFEFLSSADNFPEEKIHEIVDTFRDGFGLKDGWSIKSARHAISRSTILGLLRDENGLISGYAFYTIPDALLKGTNFLWEDAICIRKYLQGKKWTSQPLMDAICRFLPEKTFGWLGGRTQNPRVLLRYASLGNLYPFGIKKDEEPESAAVLDFLFQHIKEVKDDWPVVDPKTWICKGIYPEGKLGDYSIDIKGCEEFERELIGNGFNRDAGDAVIVVSRLRYIISAHKTGWRDANT